MKSNRRQNSNGQPTGVRTHVLSILMVGSLVLVAPQAAYAGDKEDALKDCLKKSLGILPFAAGCAAGYVIEKVKSKDGKQIVRPRKLSSRASRVAAKRQRR